MTFKTLMIEKSMNSSVEVVTLNRPHRLNALDQTMISELLEYFSSLDTKDLIRNDEEELSPRCIILKGNGRAFCAGLDLMDSVVPEHAHPRFNFQRRVSQIMLLMRRIKQPIISLLQGPVCGGGLALALASDVRLCTTDAKFNVAMAKIGLTGGDVGISYFLPRAVGLSVAAEMMMTGDFLFAPRAFQLGLVSRVFDTYEEMLKEGQALGVRMVETMTCTGLYLTKEALRFGIDAPSLESAVAMEDRQQLLRLGSDDFVEYVMKTLQKNSKVKAISTSLMSHVTNNSLSFKKY